MNIRFFLLVPVLSFYFCSSTDNIQKEDEPEPPIPFAGNDKTVETGDSVEVIGSVLSPSDRIVKWEWDIGGTGDFQNMTPDRNKFFKAPSIDSAIEYPCILRVRDEGGQVALDTIIVRVINSYPYPFAGNDTTVHTCDSLRLKGTARVLFNSITKWEWDIGGDGTFEDSLRDSRIVLPPVSTKTKVDILCMLRVTDMRQRTAVDTVIVTVKNIPPVAFAGNDTSVPVGSMFLLRGSLSSDSLGNIVKYLWDVGGTGTFIESKTGDTLIRIPEESFTTVRCNLGVIDNDGNDQYTNVFVTSGGFVKIGEFPDYNAWSFGMTDGGNSKMKSSFAEFDGKVFQLANRDRYNGKINSSTDAILWLAAGSVETLNLEYIVNLFEYNKSLWIFRLCTRYDRGWVLLKSVDQGVSWASVSNSGNAPIEYWTSSKTFVFNGYLWVRPDNSMWFTVDGESWEQKRGDYPFAGKPMSNFTVYKSKVYTISYDSGTATLYHSSDGAFWTSSGFTFEMPTASTEVRYEITPVLTATSTLITIMFKVNNYYEYDDAFEPFLYKSSNGETWVQCRLSGLPSEVSEMEPFTFKNTIYVLTKKTPDGTVEVWRLTK